MRARFSLLKTGGMSLSPMNGNALCGIALLLSILALCSLSVVAQENFLVVTEDGTLSLYDMTSYSLLESFQNEPSTYTVTPSLNNRLAFMAGGAGYGTVVDMSIGRAITPLAGVRAPASSGGHGGRYYVADDYDFTLDVVDTSTLAVVQKVNFSSVIPATGSPGAVISANDQSYIFPRNQNPQNPKAAVVALTGFQLSSIQLPPGTFCRRCVSRVPDGSLVVAIELENDGKTHILLIDTTTNHIASDIAQTKNYGVQAFVVTQNTDPTQLYGWVYSGNGGRVLQVDLRPTSQTYGQILASPTVTIPNLSVNEITSNSDGSKLIVAGAQTVHPAPNVYVVDTTSMTIATQLTASGGGIPANSVCNGIFSTTPPTGAPTVTGKSGDITNDQETDITVTGTNFQPGALVRIGSMPQLPTTVVNSTTLTVTVAKHAPAGKAQDIIVTNPLLNNPPNQQNESGLLAGQFNIRPDPAFQPATQIATIDGTFLYLYSLPQLTMVKVPLGAPGDLGYALEFNVDGLELYLVKANLVDSFYVLPVNVITQTPGTAITLPASAVAGFGQVFAASRDPQTNSPVMYLASTNSTDLHLSKIDSDPMSQTFNTIVHDFTASLNGGNYISPPIVTVSPDGKFAYVWYGSNGSRLGIFDLTTGAFVSFGNDELKVSDYQSQIYVTSDSNNNKSLLLSAFYGNRTRIKVFDISTPTNPRLVTTITPLPISRWGFPQVNNYQVIGNKLYALDFNGAVVVFNFDRAKGDFRERGYLSSPARQNFSSFVFSPDGSILYLTDYYGNSVLAAATNLLTSGKDPELTGIRAPFAPYLIAVSPVAPPPTRPSKPGATASIDAVPTAPPPAKPSKQPTPESGRSPFQSDSERQAPSFSPK